MNKWILTVIAFSLFMALTHFGNGNTIRGDPKLDFDSPFYVQALLWFRGEYPEPPNNPFRMRILNTILASYLSEIVGVNNAFGLLNTMLWILTCIVCFHAFSRHFKSYEFAGMCCLLFSGSVPVLVYGAAISTDMIGWLALAVAVYYLQKDFAFKNILLMGICLYVLMLGREVSILAIAYILVYRLLQRGDHIKTLLECAVLTAFSGLAVLTLYMFIPSPSYTAYFLPSFLDAGKAEKILEAMWQIAATYHIGWIPIILHLTRRGERKDMIFKTSLIVGGVFIVIDHLIGTVSSRFVFLTYPGLLPSILAGVRELTCSVGSEDLKKALLSLYVILYISTGFIATLENNLAFPTISDESIARLFPPS